VDVLLPSLLFDYASSRTAPNSKTHTRTNKQANTHWSSRIELSSFPPPPSFRKDTGAMYEKMGYYLQVVAAFLLLALTHYFAAGFLPIADCDETFNFIEPIHYLLYGSGKQTWELCSQYALRSWLFSWVYAWPAVFIRGAASLSSADVYFYLRIFNGRIAALAELFFVYSVWTAFSGKAAMVALLLLLVNYPIPHAAVSVLPTSFVMILNFVVLGCWLRTRAWTSAALSPAHGTTPHSTRHLRWPVGLALALSVFGGVTGWPFAGLVSVPVGLDLLFRFPTHAVLYTASAAVAVVVAGLMMDGHYYCRWTLSGWNVVAYNVFGGADRGPDLFDVEPWFFFLKNLTLNFNLMFVAVLLAPLVVLCTPRRSTCPSAHTSTLSNGESTRWFASSEEVRPAGQSPALPTSPQPRARLHPSTSPELRSPLLSSRHPHLSATTAAVTSGASKSASAAAVAAAATSARGCSRGRELLYMTPFFLWFVFWMCIAHKEERFMSPAYPFMVLAATRAICLLFFPDVEGESGATTATAVTPGVAPSPSSPFPPSSPASAGTAADSFTRASATPPPARPSATAATPHSLLRSPAALAYRRAAGCSFLILFFLLSYSRAMAIYVYYSGPERVLYDWYPVLRAEAQHLSEKKRALMASGAVAPTRGTTHQQTAELNAYYTLCLGREWYRFPSSFFLDHRWARYQFLNTTYFHGMLPVSFTTPRVGSEQGFLWSPQEEIGWRDGQRGSRVEVGSCVCGAEGVNDLNQEIPQQYVRDPLTQCDAVFDSLSPPTHVSAAEYARERAQRHLDTVFTRSLLNTTAMRDALAAEGTAYHHVDDTYAVLDVDRTALWCRVLYYPFGISRRCAAWRPLVLNAKP
jgi:alpha-1,2-mannosyltransferase